MIRQRTFPPAESRKSIKGIPFVLVCSHENSLSSLLITMQIDFSPVSCTLCFCKHLSSLLRSLLFVFCLCACDRSNVPCLGTTRLSVSPRSRLLGCTKASSPALLNKWVFSFVRRRETMPDFYLFFAHMIMCICLNVCMCVCLQVMERLCVRVQQQVCLLKGCEEGEEIQAARQILKEARDSRAVRRLALYLKTASHQN